MYNKILVFLLIGIVVGCTNKQPKLSFSKYDESLEIQNQQEHKLERMKFKTIQSKFNDMNTVFAPFEAALENFTEADYYNIEPYIIEKDIPSIQDAVRRRILSYEQIVLFYLYRIKKYESNPELALNAIISLNPAIIEEAKKKDRSGPVLDRYSISGLPILLKDNINTIGMPTTAGAFVLRNNYTENDAFIVRKLKAQGALILGKTNLSEWAYYFCGSCPLGYSAIGGQTLNPYGRLQFETGGSSSGSGVSAAANYAVATVGTETSGSILSPSSKNTIVGLKPTIGLLSRTGIVPISSTLDTPGPMTKSVIDNAILLEAMLGFDAEDQAMDSKADSLNYVEHLKQASLKGKKFGVIKSLLKDSIYRKAISLLEKYETVLVEIEPDAVALDGFSDLLNYDMKHDLPLYLSQQAVSGLGIHTIEDILKENKLDTLLRAPYGQKIFEGIVDDTNTSDQIAKVKLELKAKGTRFLKLAMDEFDLDAVLSIANYHAGYAAVAKYPCLTVPMGYQKSGEPVNLTFIGRPYEEKKLLGLGYAFETVSKSRKIPQNYQ